jgi:signal transduction histidine kinase
MSMDGGSAIRRTLARPGLLGGVLVVATLGLAGALAWQAVRASASHRAAVEAALEHHAATAAWRFTREARSWLGYGMNEARNALQGEVARHAALPGPDVLERLFAEKYCDCMTAAFARSLVRVVADGDRTLDISGEPLSERARDELRALMLSLTADTLPLRAARPWRILPPGSPRLNRGTDVALLWLVDDDRHARAVYGMIVERAQIERPLTGALEAAQFFPPQLVPAGTAATLVRVDVSGPNGVSVFSAGPETRQFSEADTLGREYGSLVAVAAINPAAAQVLVAGGLPPSRVPMVVALLALVLVNGTAGVLLLRREHRLARLREDFVSGVSHELRTPLTQIRMLGELLESEGFRSPGERTRAISVIHRESLRLTNLIDNLLDFTRRRHANGAPVGRVSLADTMHDVTDSLGPLLDAQRNRVEIVAGEDRYVRGDRDAVSRVLRNLLENAIKYGPASQTIQMTMTGNGTAARITVEDQGPGIPLSERSRIWEPYYRLDRDRQGPAGGSGLGLSVVADLVRHLGGSVAVDDAPGGGARFTIDLPGAP